MIYENRFRVLLAFAVMSAGAATGCGDEGAECGPGTVEVGGTCVPAAEACAEGTTFDPMTNTCVADGDETTCGTGTLLMGTMCVPESTGLECGTGTTPMGDVCVPDGSVLCTGSTMFDAESGTCVTDPDAICEGELVYVEATDSCVDPDTLLEGMADVTELMEPNDPEFNEGAMPQVVDIADGTGSFFGCSEPTDFDDDGVTDSDFDFFQIVVDEPTLLNVTTDGIGGANAAVAFVGGTDTDVADAAWQRFLLDLSGDGTEGQIFLPDAGTYFIIAGDGRSLLFGEPAGGPGECYFVQLEVTDLPSPSAITPGTAVTGTFGAPEFYSLTAGEGDLFFTELQEIVGGEPGDLGSLLGGSVHVIGGDFNSLSQTNGGGGFGGGAIVGLADADELLIAVDAVFNFGFDSADYEFTLVDTGTQLLPEADTVTITNDDETGNWFYFDVAEAGQVVELSVDTTEDIDLFVFGPDGSGAAMCFSCGADALFLNTLEAGTHYARIDLFGGDAGTEFDVAFTRRHITPTELTAGTGAAADLSDGEREFFTIDLSAADWNSFDVSAFTALSTARVAGYDRTAFGALDFSLVSAFDGTADEDEGVFYIPAGEGLSLLVSVEDDAGHDADEMLTLTSNPVTFDDLGTVNEAAPATRTDVTLEADGIVYFLVRADVPGETLRVVASSDDDLEIVVYEIPAGAIDEVIDEAGSGTDEALSGVVTDGGIVRAFAIREFFGDATTFSLNVTAEPPPYTEAPAAIDFVSICPDEGGAGTVLTSGDDASEIVDLSALAPTFPFTFFGESVTEMYVVTNGFVKFGEAPIGFFETLQPGDFNVISPFGGDLIADEVCVLQDGTDTYTVEWRGRGFSDADPVEMQMVMHGTGEIDFVYGASHQNGTSGRLAGLRSATGLELQGAVFPPAASSAVTWTPAE